MRRGLSLRSQLILLLGALVLVATASLGSIAYNSSRTIIERAAVREVGITANARKQALIRVLTEQRVRAAALLKTASLGCAPEEIRCVRRVLADFVDTAGGSAVQLAYRGRAPIAVGPESESLRRIQAPAENQLASFHFDQRGHPYYIIVVRAVLRDGEMVVTVRDDMRVLKEIFADAYGLGRTGETLLTDSNGVFLTAPRYSGSDIPRAAPGKAIQSCLAGTDAEVLDQDYRGIPVIRGLRHIPEIGGGCVVALTEQAEAFAPTIGLRKEVGGISILLAVLAIAGSLTFAQIVSRPIKRLRDRARLLQAGDFDSPVPAGGPTELQMFAHTFEGMASSLKDSRSALQASNEQISNILESISDGFIALDREWRCTYVNARASALSRTPREQLLDKNLWEVFSDKVSGTARLTLQRAMRDAVPVHFEEYYAPFDMWFEFDAFPTNEGLAVFGRDVTERKRFNERLQQTQKLESLGVLAGGIAHDFNNLLTGIIGNASLVLDELAPGDPARRSLQSVVTAGERASALTRQLLAYAGKGQFVTQLLDLSNLVRETSSLLHTSIPRTVQLRLQLMEGQVLIEADATQIQQLIMNLVINAAEAIGEGKNGTVLVITGIQDVDNAYIMQTLTPNEILPGRYVILEVHDTGCGMDDATIRRIFDPFFTTKFAGRGLGLAAAMGIVRGHKGALKVYSVPAKGTSFKVLFPAAGGVIVEAPPAGYEETLSGKGTILVIDDEDVVRRTAKSALEHQGYRVLLAENGQEGVDLFRRRRDEVSLVLLDMTMPVMSGEEALTELKNIRADIPVILSSGYNEAEATRRFTGQQFAGFIEKPYTAQRLAEQVKRTLGAAEHGKASDTAGQAAG